MEIGQWMMLIGVFLVFGVPAWPRVLLWWKEKKRTERVLDLAREWDALSEHAENLRDFLSEEKAREDDRAEAVVLLGHAEDRMAEIDADILGVDLEALREENGRVLG